MTSKTSYARSAEIRRAVTALTKAGIQIGSVILHTDGTIEIFRQERPLATAANEFDVLDKAGKI